VTSNEVPRSVHVCAGQVYYLVRFRFLLFCTIYKNNNFHSINRTYTNEKEKRILTGNSQNEMCLVTKVALGFGVGY